MQLRAGFRCSALSLTTTLLAAVQLSDAVSVSSFWSQDSASRAGGLSRRADKNTTTTPAPIDVSPSQYWDGIGAYMVVFGNVLGIAD